MTKHARYCVVCGKDLDPFHPSTLTAHEYDCFKRRPDLIPDHFQEAYKSTLAWEKRHIAGLKAALKRKGRKTDG